MISDNSREARHPFLDESFMKTVSEIPLHYISDYTAIRGIGDKKVLRMVAGNFFKIDI